MRERGGGEEEKKREQKELSTTLKATLKHPPFIYALICPKLNELQINPFCFLILSKRKTATKTCGLRISHFQLESVSPSTMTWCHYARFTLCSMSKSNRVIFSLSNWTIHLWATRETPPRDYVILLWIHFQQSTAPFIVILPQATRLNSQSNLEQEGRGWHSFSLFYRWIRKNTKDKVSHPGSQ